MPGKKNKTRNQEVIEMLMIQRENMENQEAVEDRRKSITVRIDIIFYERILAISNLTRESVSSLAQTMVLNGIEEMSDYINLLDENGDIRSEFSLKEEGKK